MLFRRRGDLEGDGGDGAEGDAAGAADGGPQMTRMDTDKGKHGEPWEPWDEEIEGGIVAQREKPRPVIGPTYYIGDFENMAHRDHAIACVNALDGLVPEALAEVIAALHEREANGEGYDLALARLEGRDEH